MTNSEGDRANDSDNDHAHDLPDSRAHVGGNGRPQKGPPKPQRSNEEYPPNEEYQECLEEIAAIVASDADPTVTLAQLALVLSEAEDRGLISADSPGE